MKKSVLKLSAAIIGIFGAQSGAASTSSETEMWTKTLSTGSFKAYTEFLNSYPESIFAKDARKMIETSNTREVAALAIKPSAPKVLQNDAAPSHATGNLFAI